jgi:glutathione S-transferase
MAGVYRIFGSELSPYSVKVRSYFRYKKIPHTWVIRNALSEEEFQRYARLPLVPLVVMPDAKGIQDSTPIIEHFEALHLEPSIHPEDAACAFLSALVEEYADEWGNKPMFHYRWFYEADRNSAGERIARSLMPGAAEDAIPGMIEMIRRRMVPRLPFVGSSEKTKNTIEGSFRRQIAILDRHLEGRKYLFGDRPALADFGLFAQLHQCATDPTPGAILAAEAPRVLVWTRRMMDPAREGPFERWDALVRTLLPLLRDEIGGLFLPWSTANAAALATGEKEFTVTLEGRPFTQETQKYHAKSLAALRARYAAVHDKPALDPVLREAGCLKWLAGGP